MPASRCRAPASSVTPFLESDPVLGDVDEHFAGNYLDEATILKLARDKGYTHRRGRQARPDADLRSHRPQRRRRPSSSTTRPAAAKGIPLSAEMTDRLKARTCRWRRRRAAPTAMPAT